MFYALLIFFILFNTFKLDRIDIKNILQQISILN